MKWVFQSLKCNSVFKNNNLINMFTHYIFNGMIMCCVLLRTSHLEVSDVCLFLNSAKNWSRCGLPFPLYNSTSPTTHPKSHKWSVERFIFIMHISFSLLRVIPRFSFHWESHPDSVFSMTVQSDGFPTPTLLLQKPISSQHSTVSNLHNVIKQCYPRKFKNKKALSCLLLIWRK